MKLLLIVDDYLPHSIKVAAKMMHELALEFRKNGHHVVVLSPKPLQKEKLLIKRIDGVEVLFFRSGEIKNTGKIKRAINETLLSFYAWKAAKRYFSENYFDGIVYYSPSIFWGSLVKKLTKHWNCKSYLILRDIFPQWTIDNGLMKKNSIIHRYFRYFEKISYNSAGKIGVMSPSNLKFFKDKRTDISKFEVLFNWAEIPSVPKQQNIIRKKLNLEEKIVLFYGGNIGHAQNMIYLVNLAKQFKNNSNVHFLFVGKGDEVDLILNEKEKHNLTNITYLPSVDQKTYFEMLNEFDIGMFSLHPSHKTHNFPGKLLGYMGYSKPILGCVNTGNDLKDIVNNANAGLIVDSDDEEGLYQSAKKLIDSEPLRKKMGANGKLLLSNQFSIKNTASQIERSLN
ncbi:MAG: glycosyltransferase family 4 protein [Bacteroidota bacterium]